MPIIDHSMQALSEIEDRIRERALITPAHGAISLTVTEMVMQPGATRKWQTHPTDIAFMLMEGSIQMTVGEDVRTVRSGSTLLAPPGVPYKLVNNTWIAARMLVITPTDHLETDVLE